MPKVETAVVIDLLKMAQVDEIAVAGGAVIVYSQAIGLPRNATFCATIKASSGGTITLAIELERVKQNSGNSGGDNGGGDNPAGDQPKNDGNNSPGRPPSTKDTGPRDQRTPVSLSILNTVADSLMIGIDETLDDTYLKNNNIKNMRSMTKAQRKELERTKRGILSVLQLGDVPTKSLIVDRLDATSNITDQMESVFCGLMSEFTVSTQKEPNIKERRMLTALAWASVNQE